MVKVKRALLSVFDKRGLIPLAKTLATQEIEIISTGGTYSVLRDAGIRAIKVEEVTSFPEVLDGRVKTLHPNIHAAILAKRTEDHLSQLKKVGIVPIDLVVVNLYPFEETILKTDVLEEIIENIDIGGLAMIRAAAKNYRYVATVVNPERYEEIITILQENNGMIPEEVRFRLSCEAFSYTASYDVLISQYLSRRLDKTFPDVLNLSYYKVQNLRYGENPHQRASFYKLRGIEEPCIGNAKKLHGKELSFNNILDLNAALELVKEFREKVCVIIKHTNPCGVAIGNTLKDAYNKAYQSDPISAFGSVVGFNEVVSEDVAEDLITKYVEAIIAPGFTETALRILRKKKNLRLLEVQKPLNIIQRKEMDMRKVVGGLLIQDWDLDMHPSDSLKTVTRQKPSPQELKTALFAWKVVKCVKSNAIVLARDGSTVGVGAGQMSRVDAVRIAISKAGDRTKGAVLASDAFFPFKDSIDLAGEAGIKVIIQPGGSLRDEEVIKACDRYNISMVFTGIRHFRH
ncbi:MAG: bifunctional phosphoribosylaminoimidazolecarboxamide formyltransferase/IMP cyclohydrolase [bacterium]|nr:bifunctional phosphoribosylaminoimidazolecarboxamide formyltransferase/IMP cyclohydrolase [bacterium]